MSPIERKELAILRVYGLVTTLLLTIFTVTGFRQTQKAKFTEIDVERINIVEPDGNYRMVISNKTRSIGPIAYGKPFGYPGGTRPGIIFFNDEATETGGLTFGGKTENGKFQATGHLSFDQYNQDQVLYLTYNDDNGRRRMGLTVADRADVPIMDLVAKMDSIRALPDGPAKQAAMQQLQATRVNGAPLFAERVYVGRNPAKAALLRLSDGDGKPRIVLQVDSLGAPSLQFLDGSGRVISQLPDR
ncbi:MAG: hypothetical protein ACKVZ0_18900 [Gemmatimonadales bacterium]